MREEEKKSEELQVLPTPGLLPRTIAEATALADIVAKTDMVPADYKGKGGNCLVAILMGAEIGLKPMQAIQNIAVINGRPSVYGDAMLAICQVHPDFESIQEVFEGDPTKEQGTFRAVCTIKRKGANPVTQSFSVAQAKKAGLWTKAGPWSNYPSRMLQMRARSWALRDQFADALKGVASAEEMQDVIDVVAESAVTLPDGVHPVSPAETPPAPEAATQTEKTGKGDGSDKGGESKGEPFGFE